MSGLPAQVCATQNEVGAGMMVVALLLKMRVAGLFSGRQDLIRNPSKKTKQATLLHQDTCVSPCCLTIRGVVEV